MKRKLHIAIILTLTLVCLILPQAAALAATYYVDATNGNDNNPGTIGQPWKTIQKAANTLAPSDTVIVNSGSYDEAVSIRKSGSTDNPITYKAEGQVITKGFVVEADHIHIIGFEVTDVPDNKEAGISVKGHYNQILGNYIHHTSDQANGILIVGHWPQWGDIYNESTNNLVKGNRIEYARECGIKTFGTNNIIEGNHISHTITYGDADGMRFFGKGHIIKKNYIHDISYEEAGGDPHIDCFQTWGPAIDIIFERNICELLKPPPETSYQIAMISSISEMNSPVKNLTFRNNIFKSSSNGYCPVNIHGGIPMRIEDIFILHNTFIRDSGRGAYGVRLINVTNAVVKNNIFYDAADEWRSYIFLEEECENLDIGNNLIYMSDDKPIAGEPYPNDLWLINPRFFDFGNSDFHLMSESPCIDAGVDVGVTEDFEGNPRPRGAGYDIGAYEYMQANQPPLANAGPDQSVIDSDRNGSEQVNLDGSVSSDPDGTIVSFIWREGATQIAAGVKPTVTLSTGTHTITLTVTDDGGLIDTDTVTIKVLKGDKGFGELPTGCYNNVINPSNGEKATIVAGIEKQDYIRIAVYDTKGNKIKELADEEKEADVYEYYWDGKDESGNIVGSGLYFVHIQAGDYKKTKKIVVIK